MSLIAGVDAEVDVESEGAFIESTLAGSLLELQAANNAIEATMQIFFIIVDLV
jgi:hypothetical protein